MFENVLEVLDHQFNGRVHIVPTIAALMREAEASADYLYSQSKMDPRPASYALQA